MLRYRGAGLWPTASRPGCPPVGLAPAAPLVTAPLAVAPPEKAAHEPTQSSHLRAGAAASVRRSLLGGVEPITSLHEVVHPTHHRQYDCNPKQARCQPTRIQDHRDYGHHLAGCLCLSPLARRMITFSAAATMRRPDTANSLAIITIATHADTLPRSTKATSAAEIRSLSAKGSRNVPSTVVWLLRRAK